MKYTNRLKSKILVVISVVMSAVGLAPALMGTAHAAQITSRSLTLSTAQASATGATYLFTYTLPDTGNVGSMEFIFCTTPIGACTAPTGLSVTAATIGAQTTNTGFALGGGGDAPSNSATSSAFLGSLTTVPRVRVTRTVAAGSTSAATIRFDTITNPSNATQTPAGNNSFYVRFATFADIAYATNNATNDDGVVAAAIVPLLTITARVQEVLHFCVGSMITGDTFTGDDCSSEVTTNGATVDLGPVASDGTTITPVTVVGNITTDDRDGAFMLRTNANNGSTVSYYSVAFGGGAQGNLKKTGTACGANTAADGCFNSSNAGAALVANTEWFGMRLLGDDTASTAPTTALDATAPYNSGTDYSWEMVTTTIDQVASAASAVDDEAFRLRFAAVTALTTPTGQYSTSADFIAVATY